MNILIIDTSSNNPYLAMLKNQEVAKYTLIARDTCAEELILKLADFDLDTIDLLAVKIGFGSWTGTRIGLIVSKTIAFLKNISIIGFLEKDDNSKDTKKAIQKAYEKIKEKIKLKDFDNPLTLDAHYEKEPSGIKTLANK